MLDQSDAQIEKIKAPSKQLVLDWIEHANSTLNFNTCIITKSFLVTGLSNALGGHENQLIRDNVVRKEIEEIMVEVFGEDTMGFQSEEDNDGLDPFGSSDSETSVDELSGGDESISAPDFELFSEDEGLTPVPDN